jgi:hypothetical protein
LGFVPLLALGLNWSRFLPVTLAWAVLGFPITIWRSRVARTKRFILHTQRTGSQLAVAPEARSVIADGIADYERLRRNQQVVGEPSNIEKASE